MKFIYPFLFAFIYAFSSQAQDLKTLSIKDVSVNYSLYPRGLSNLQWRPAAKTENETYTYTNAEGLQEVNLAGEKGLLLSLEKLNEQLEALQISSQGRFPSITWHSEKNFSFNADNTVWNYHLDDGLNKWFSIPANAQGLEYMQRDNDAVYSYTVDNDLYVNGRKINESKAGFTYGQAVHRYEFGIGKGTFWSPKGSHLAFYENDQRSVTDYPVLDITKPIAEVKEVKYPMAGTANERVRIGIYDLESKETIYLNTPEEDVYLTNIAWHPSGEWLVVGVLNRDQDHLKWQAYSAADGSLLKQFHEEKDEAFVEPLHPFYFNEQSDESYAYLSWKDGFTHIYYVDDSGKEKQLTKGDFEVTNFLGYDSEGEHIFFSSTEESALEQHIYQIGVKGGKPKKVSSKNAGQHSAILSPSGTHLIDQFSNRNVARKGICLSSKGKELHEVYDAGNPMQEYHKNTVEFGHFKADDGKTKLHYRLIKPYNFNPEKEYPAIVYVYGGPHAQMVKESWLGSASLFLHYLAQQGFVVFTVDNRGSDNRGKAFEQITHRQLGSIEMKDQLTGLQFLQSMSFIDPDRIGVHGWSFGGFMTTSLMTRHAGKFKVGVCGGPVIDWKYYEIMYTERYMDSPRSNPQGYEEANLLNYAKNLEGELLIVHGAADDVVVWQHTLSYLDKCVEQSVQLDYFPYTGHKHHVQGRDRIHLQQKMADYFIEKL